MIANAMGTRTDRMVQTPSKAAIALLPARLARAMPPPPGGLASGPGLLAGDFAVPARMMQPRPTPGHRPARHGAEGPRLGGSPQIDVPDDHREEQAERHVVHEVAGFAYPLPEGEGEPHDQAAREEPQGAQRGGPEEQLLAAVVLADLEVVVAILEIANEAPGGEELAVRAREPHLREPLREHEHRGGREGDSRPRVEPAADVQPAEQRRQEAEVGRPDGQAGEQADEERQGDGPVDHARR